VTAKQTHTIKYTKFTFIRG